MLRVARCMLRVAYCACCVACIACCVVCWCCVLRAVLHIVCIARCTLDVAMGLMSKKAIHGQK